MKITVDAIYFPSESFVDAPELCHKLTPSPILARISHMRPNLATCGQRGRYSRLLPTYQVELPSICSFIHEPCFLNRLSWTRHSLCHLRKEEVKIYLNPKPVWLNGLAKSRLCKERWMLMRKLSRRDSRKRLLPHEKLVLGEVVAEGLEVASIAWKRVRYLSHLCSNDV